MKRKTVDDGLSGKEKFPDAAVSKDGHIDSLLRLVKTRQYWFP